MYHFEINGNKFHAENGFYNHVHKIFTEGLSWKIDNVNTFADILEGGFGKHAFREEIVVTWKKFKKSEERLNPNFLKIILEIIHDQENVKFKTEDY